MIPKLWAIVPVPGPSPEKRGPWPRSALFGTGRGPGPMAHDVGPMPCPMSYGLVLWPCLMSEWSSVPWLCPLSCGPVLRLMALSQVLRPSPILTHVSHGPVLCPMSQIHMKWFEVRPNGKPTTANGMASRGGPFRTAIGQPKNT